MEVVGELCPLRLHLELRKYSVNALGQIYCLAPETIAGYSLHKKMCRCMDASSLWQRTTRRQVALLLLAKYMMCDMPVTTCTSHHGLESYCMMQLDCNADCIYFGAELLEVLNMTEPAVAMASLLTFLLRTRSPILHA